LPRPRRSLEGDCAAVEPRAFDEREHASSFERREQRLAAAERDRVHGQAVLVDEVGAHEALGEGRASIAGRPLRANTTFGMSFIGGANTSVEYGQYDAQPANERLPMM
jgi:hypothetical protein